MNHGYSILNNIIINIYKLVALYKLLPFQNLFDKRKSLRWDKNDGFLINIRIRDNPFIKKKKDKGQPPPKRTKGPKKKNTVKEIIDIYVIYPFLFDAVI